jgi:hypothetical protein
MVGKKNEPELAGFPDVENFASLIVAAFGASAMRHFLLVAVRALGQGVTFQGIVCAPCRRALLGMSPFRIRHG